MTLIEPVDHIRTLLRDLKSRLESFLEEHPEFPVKAMKFELTVTTLDGESRVFGVVVDKPRKALRNEEVD